MLRVLRNGEYRYFYAERVKTRRKYIKLSLAAGVLQQIICTVKIRGAPTFAWHERSSKTSQSETSQ